MIINHNIAALNTHRQMGSAQSAQMDSMEKLSSGLRINSAKDDAAGLTISEKMRGQIRGLEQASTNAQDGISLLQTAEGAMSETQDILQRMRELAVQSANGTNTDQDRGEIQKEVNELAKEITRISENTEFNTMNLLGKEGKGFEGKFHIGANMGQNIDLQINDMGAKALGVNEVTAGVDTTIGDLTVNNLTADGYTVKFTAAGEGAVTETTASVDKGAKTITVTLAQAAGTAGTAGALTGTNSDIAKVLESTGLVKAVAETPEAVGTVETDTVVAAGTADITKGINVSSQETASTAIKTINNAIETVSSERSKLGATQNRLEHTINNLNTSSENLTSAESRIRDVDYAKAA